ncbi:MAG TPA: hypothetical protein VEL31_04060 [Ktedonobacteraceae bacterium]|nr:hypothetical protein [Ktedonobacteraceae bacterium]
MYRYTTFALASLFPVGLRSSNRLRLVKVRVKSTEKFNVHILVISIIIPAAQFPWEPVPFVIGPDYDAQNASLLLPGRFDGKLSAIPSF